MKCPKAFLMEFGLAWLIGIIALSAHAYADPIYYNFSGKFKLVSGTDVLGLDGSSITASWTIDTNTLTYQQGASNAWFHTTDVSITVGTITTSPTLNLSIGPSDQIFTDYFPAGSGSAQIDIWMKSTSSIIHSPYPPVTYTMDDFQSVGNFAAGGSEYTYADVNTSALILGQIKDNSWFFDDIPNNHWIDPPTAYGYSYQMAPGEDSLFTQITDWAPGFAGPFTVTSAEGVATVSPGGIYTFPTPVSGFTVTGINPLLDATNPAAFPIRLGFNNGNAAFSITPLVADSAIPEPASLLLLGSGLSLIGLFVWRRKK